MINYCIIDYLEATLSLQIIFLNYLKGINNIV